MHAARAAAKPRASGGRTSGGAPLVASGGRTSGGAPLVGTGAARGAREGLWSE